MRKSSHRPASGTVTVGGFTATRTRRAQSPATKHKVSERRVMQMRQVAYQMAMEYVSHADIARALGVSRPRITTLINAEFEARRVLLGKTEQQWRELEVLRTEHMQSKWATKATSNAPAANVYLSLAERKDRLLGLNHSSLSITTPPADPNAPPYDYSLLTDKQLSTVEHLLQIAAGVIPPEPDEPPAPQIPQPLAIADDRNVVTVVEREETLGDRILHLHREGSTPEEIRAALNLSHAEFLAAIEAPRVPS